MQSAATIEAQNPTLATAAAAGNGAASAEQPVAASPATPRQRIQTRLNIYFAIAVCLSGLTLTGNPETEMLPVIACFFAIFGLTFVDLLRWFALPPTAAYLSLGAIALYSIGRFTDRPEETADDLQMVIVAELLVLVQAVLMLQQKNRRIYEQLAIFCLLELIVAAIFNDALSYGLLLLPLGFVGAVALALLQTYQTTEGVFAVEGRSRGDHPTVNAVIQVSASRSADSFHRAGLALPWMVLTVLTPAVLMISLLFFYGLPRTSAATKRSAGGRVLVGFSESVQLGQIGQMLQSDALAARIDLINPRTGKPYVVSGSLYLRGAVLETYATNPAHEGTWEASEVRPRSTLWQLPPAAERPDSEMAADEVRVRITVESSNSASLFAVAPYHQLGTGPEVIHQRERWLLKRRRGLNVPESGRITYQFGTTAFRGGEQTQFLPRYPDQAGVDASRGAGDSNSVRQFQMREQSQQNRMDAESYTKRCLEYDEYRIPSAWRLSDVLISTAGQRIENPFEIATTFEQFLSSYGGYRYTLNLTGETMPGLDPVEQFLSVDRQGNCQYFASAMVLMLRSQGIPARLVVGYNTDEFNTIGGFYVARQLHAHAWVEALMDAKRLPQGKLSPGGRDGDQYWVRFDPTPGGGGVDRAVGGPVSEVFELAQNMWTDYVVQRSAPSARRDGLGGGGSEGVTSQYQALILWGERKLAQIRTGQLGGGALSIGREFSWTAAILSIALALLILAVYQFGWPTGRLWIPFFKLGSKKRPALPQVPFFAETLRLLERVGIERSIGQTPLELTTQAAQKLHRPGAASVDGPLRLLTDAFYDTRFGVAAGSDPLSWKSVDAEVMAALQSVRARIEMIETRAPTNPS